MIPLIKAMDYTYTCEFSMNMLGEHVSAWRANCEIGDPYVEIGHDGALLGMIRWVDTLLVLEVPTGMPTVPRTWEHRKPPLFRRKR